MSEGLSFNIKETFTGIYRAIAEKANLNGDDKLEGDDEISLFYEAKKTIDPQTNSVFIFDGKLYDKNGNETSGITFFAKNDGIQKPVIPELKLENDMAELKNFNANKSIDDYMKNLPPEKAEKLKVLRECKQKTYNYALTHIKDDKLTPEEIETKAKEITSVVIDKCKQFDAVELAPVIIQIVKVECDFNYSKSNLTAKRHGNKGFNGSGQCTYQTVGVVTGASGATKLEKEEHNNYLNGYKKEIADFLNSYDNPSKDELWNLLSINKDLGIEIAILTILERLRYNNSSHSIKKALSNYGGAYTSSNKKLDWSIMPKTFTPKT